MKKPILFFAWALALAASVSAAQRPARVTVDELSQLLRNARGQEDSRLARQLSRLQLTQRAATSLLVSWQEEFSGRQTRLALTALVDASAFLDPPPASILSLPQPDSQRLRDIALRAGDHAKESAARLPDFYAQRIITYFVGTPPHAPNWPDFCKTKTPAFGSGCFTVGAGNSDEGQAGNGSLRLTGETRETITYRDGTEMLSEQSADPLSPLEFLSLVTSGEFGPILTVVLDDALQGEIAWGFWEQGATGPLAVIRYRVARAGSHYQLEYPFPMGLEKIQPAYHGEIAIDPATGTIMRINIVGDLDLPNPQLATAVMLEYAPVSIGGKSYTCPVRGVAYSRVPVFARRAGKSTELPFMQTLLNDVRFTEYHLFRGDVKILPQAEAASGSAAPPAQ